MSHTHHNHMATGQWVPHGMHDSRDGELEMLANMGYQQFQTKPIHLPQWFRTWAHNVQEACNVVQRLGLPHSTVFDKCPLHKNKTDEQMPRMVNKKIATVISARESGVLYRSDTVPAYARHPPPHMMSWTPGE
mmetsp:Transcript_37475/g.105828  ORF Transcript_37475/g.105828 Transcript_37475/m.105828 type:complete len:133 (-) Transcript_37475:454-852(-)